jgi:D-alanyl-D-alanine carboxypeptidase (penicillin-binding protein 5/6)
VRRQALLIALVVLAWPTLAGAAPPPPVPLAAYTVVDGADGHVLASSNAHGVRSIASLTKLMTAYLAVRAGALTRTFTVPASATRIGESTVRLRAGQRIAGRTLLEALMVPSANDAAETLAVGIAGSRAAFVARMNATARRLGLHETSFVTPYGLDAPGQHSSAADQLALARLVVRNATMRRIVDRRSVVVNGARYAARNTLLGVYPGLDGVKTGHTSRAGWCLAASARQDGHRLFVVGLGARDQATRDAAIARLLDWGFTRYRQVTLLRRGDPIGLLQTPYGDPVAVVVGGRLTVELRADARPTLRYRLPDMATPPLPAGGAVGVVEALVRGRVVATVPLVTAAAVAAPDLLARLGWYAARTFGA